MEITTGRIKVEKTARYLMVGDPMLEYDEILFVLHGYGMQVTEFIQNFAILGRPGRLIIAPEGQSRFYRKAFSGDVVASWMTKEDRLYDIEDYIHYLNSLYLTFNPDPKVKKVVLGFSQGVTTASRWIMNGKCPVDEIVLWCGEFARDIEEMPSKLPRIWHVSALKDEFIAKERFEMQSEYLSNMGFRVNEYSFDGGHIIDQATLMKVWKDMSL